MSTAPPTPTRRAAADDTTAALQVRVFAWYLGVALVGKTLLWAVVPHFASPTQSLMASALLPTVIAFEALSLVVLWRWPQLLRVLHVAQFASYFPVLLGYLAVTMTTAADPVARQIAIAAFAVWIPAVVAVSFHVFGSRDGLLAALAFVAAAASVVALAVDRGATLVGPGIAYVAVLAVASFAFTAILYGTSRIAERLAAARIESAVAAERALRDGLTGVHTRFALAERFDQEIARARRGGRPLAVYFLDLDGFKDVNDAHGHATGDALLRAFAGRVQGIVRGSDTVGRLGGDEFVVLANVVGDEEAHALAERLVASCAEPVALDGTDFELSVSVGVAVHPYDGVDLESLLRAADAAMYAAKATGRRRWSAHVRIKAARTGDQEGGGGAPIEGARSDRACAAPV